MEIWDRALAFMDAQVLLTAEELGVFNQLDSGAKSAADIAAAAALPEDSAERLLIALAAQDLVRREPDGRYVNTRASSEQLVRGKPGYIGAMFQHVREDLYPIWQHFGHALREGQPQWNRAFPDRPRANDKIHSDPDALRGFMEGMHAITLEAAREFSGLAPELRSIETITDVGGASGAFLIALAGAHPHLRGTVYDLPVVGPIAERFIAEAGMAERLRFHGGDFWEEEIPAGSDAYALGFILHDWDQAGQARLLEKLARTIRPGALLVVGEYLLDDDKAGPLWVARSDLNMLTAACGGRERSAPEYRAWIGRFGFEMGPIYRTSKGKNFMIFRRV